MVFKNIKMEVFILLFFLLFTFFYTKSNTRLNIIQPQIVYVEKKTIVPIKQYITTQKQVDCMAEAMYFEARNQPETGEKAVAHVIINRATSGLFPKTICGVVHQRSDNGCQFSYRCQSTHTKVKDKESYMKSLMLAKEVINGETDFTSNAMFYHTRQVHPKWADKFHIVAYIGDHIFYSGS